MSNQFYANLVPRPTQIERPDAQQDSPSPGLRESAFWALVALVAAAVLLDFNRPETILWREIFDFLHVVFSAFAAIVAVRLCSKLLVGVASRPVFLFLISGAIAWGIGIALEIAQSVFPGTPSMGDVARDALGVSTGLALAATTNGQCLARRYNKLRWAMRSGALLCLAVTFIPTIRTLLPVMKRTELFPVIADFEYAFDERFVRAENGAWMARILAPKEFDHANGMVGLVQFKPSHYPKLEISQLDGDWTPYAYLLIDIYSPAKSPLTAMIRIHDDQHNNRLDDRFNQQLLIKSGQNRILIPVRDIRSAPKQRTIRLDAIKSIIFFLISPKTPTNLLFDNIRLVSRDEAGAIIGPDIEAPGILKPNLCGAKLEQLFQPDFPWNQRIDDQPFDQKSHQIIHYLADQHTSEQRFRIDRPRDTPDSLFGMTILDGAGVNPSPFLPDLGFYRPDCDVAPIPLPLVGAIEGNESFASNNGGDCNLLVIDRESCVLNEMFIANKALEVFKGGCHAKWDLRAPYTAELRDDCCTSADAAVFSKLSND